jgi:hypothetical protein
MHRRCEAKSFGTTLLAVAGCKKNKFKTRNSLEKKLRKEALTVEDPKEKLTTSFPF